MHLLGRLTWCLWRSFLISNKCSLLNILLPECIHSLDAHSIFVRFSNGVFFIKEFSKLAEGWVGSSGPAFDKNGIFYFTESSRKIDGNYRGRVLKINKSSGIVRILMPYLNLPSGHCTYNVRTSYVHCTNCTYNVHTLYVHCPLGNGKNNRLVFRCYHYLHIMDAFLFCLVPSMLFPWAAIPLPIQPPPPHLPPPPPKPSIPLTLPNILFLSTLYVEHLSTTCCSFSLSPPYIFGMFYPLSNHTSNFFSSLLLYFPNVLLFFIPSGHFCLSHSATAAFTSVSHVIWPIRNLAPSSSVKNSQWTDFHGPYSQINFRNRNVFSCV